jgi:hypothetical protein
MSCISALRAMRTRSRRFHILQNFIDLQNDSPPSLSHFIPAFDHYDVQYSLQRFSGHQDSCATTEIRWVSNIDQTWLLPARYSPSIEREPVVVGSCHSEVGSHLSTTTGRAQPGLRHRGWR